jgi:hypothetical protein
MSAALAGWIQRAAGAALACCVGAVARAEVSCPDQLAVQQRAEAPDGWNVSYSQAAPRLIGVSLFDGPPSNRAGLKPDARKQTAKELLLVWNLRHTPRSHYLQCTYERTSASISTALPPGVQRCEVAYERNAPLPGGSMPVKRMVCR